MMKKIFTKGFIAVALVAVVGFVSSCKDYNDEIMAEYRGQDAELKLTDADLQNQINKHVKDMLDSLKNVEERRGALEDSLEKYILKAEEIYATQDELGDSISDVRKDLKDSINNAILALADVYVKQSDYNAKVKELMAADSLLKETIADLQKKDTLLNERIDSIIKTFATIDSLNVVKSDVTDLLSKAADLQRQANLNSAEIETIKDIIANIKQCTDCDSLAAITAALEAKVDTLAGIEYTKNLVDAAYERAAKHADDALNAALENYVKPNIDNIIDIITDLVGSVEANKDSIADLRSDLNELNDLIAENKKAIKALNSRVDDLEDALNARISNILVQGAYSPVVGYFNIPFGIKSNILAAYKGEVIEPMNFPFGYIDGKINELIPLKSSLGYPGEEVEELAHGCAGKLYLTINPAEVNLDSVDFALVNSQNELAPVKFDSVVVSSDVLKFGYTRAGAPLYEASAHITDFDAASLDMNLGDYKDILSDLKNGQMNLTDIASTLYSSINDIAEAYAVRASWTDSLSLGEHSVYSDFAVAAVAVKPLAFTFLQDLNLQSVPGFTRVQNFIDKAFDKVNIALPSFDGLNFTAPEIKKIAIKDFDELGVNTEIIITDVVEYTLNMEVPVEDVVMDDLNGTTQKITVTVPEKTHSVKLDSVDQQLTIPSYTIEVPASNFTVVGPTVKIQNVKINKVLEIPFTVKYDMKDIVKDLYGSVTEPIEDVNEMLGDLEDFMDDVNGMLDELKKVQDLEQSITDAMDGIKSQLNSYLDKLNNKLCNTVNSLNDKLQPAMFVKTTNSFGVLSQSKSMPTVIENGAILVPTTYTAEVLAPASKKYVAITAVDGSTDNLAAANTGDLNKVLEGNVRAVEFNGQAGKTYELTYAALDYAGNVSTVKYYVTVK